MRQKSGAAKTPSEQIVRDIRRATRKHYSAEDKIRIVLDGLRGEYSIAELCRREGIAESLYYRGERGSLKGAPAWCTVRHRPRQRFVRIQDRARHAGKRLPSRYDIIGRPR